MSHTLTIQVLPCRYAVARLAADADFPDWLNGPGFQVATRADDELTIVCHADRVPSGIEVERDWICLRTIGPFAFDASGIVHSLISPLSNNGIGVFVICTFDGEHLLVPQKQFDEAMRYLELAGHEVERVLDHD